MARSVAAGAYQASSCFVDMCSPIIEKAAVCTDVTLDLLDAVGELHSACGILYAT